MEWYCLVTLTDL